jgi:hypothetical protein
MVLMCPCHPPGQEGTSRLLKPRSKRILFFFFYPIDETPAGRAMFKDVHTFRQACLDTSRTMDPYFILSLYAEQDQPAALLSGIVLKKTENGTHKEFRRI